MATHKWILSPPRDGPTRRRLFGPVDREQLQMEYQAALRKDLDEASLRWGFDFVSEKPLENSDFQWEGIPGTNVPLLYRSCLFDSVKAEGQRAPVAAAAAPLKRGRVGLAQSEKENIPCTPEKCAFHLENMEKTPERRERAELKRKQTNITDFYPSKRKMVGMPRKSGE